MCSERMGYSCLQAKPLLSRPGRKPEGRTFIRDGLHARHGYLGLDRVPEKNVLRQLLKVIRLAVLVCRSAQ